MLSWLLYVPLVALYLAAGLGTLYYAVKVFGPLPTLPKHHTEKQADKLFSAFSAYVFLFAIWPLTIWLLLGISVYRHAISPSDTKNKFSFLKSQYDPGYTLKLEKDIEELNRIIDKHRPEDKKLENKAS